MNCLLLGGAPNVGKTGTIIRLYFDLLDRLNINTLQDQKKLPQEVHKTPKGKIPNDFMWILEIQDQEHKTIRIIINTAADDTKSINAFKKFFDDNFGEKGYDILISPIRDDFNKPNSRYRNLFLTKIPINNTGDFILEIPCGEANINGVRRTALEWYQDKIDDLIEHILKNAPFNLLASSRLKRNCNYRKHNILSL
ncbi:MAG TPA: hypothetical protein PK776_06655 [Flavobacterium sp.]|nr:hypothetical protein [Flavobacterium sp.]